MRRVRNVGEVAGGPDQIHLAVRDALGAAGTLLMYAGCPSYYDDVGRGVLSAEQESEVLAKHHTPTGRTGSLRT